jgi:hypothetical protein
VASPARFTAFFARFARFFGIEFVCSTLFMGRMPAFPAGCTRFLRIELVRGTFLMGGLPAFPAGFARLFRSKLMSRAFLVSGFSALARYFTLPAFVHRGKTALARAAASVAAMPVSI